jgi:hypothetical protein
MCLIPDDATLSKIMVGCMAQSPMLSGSLVLFYGDRGGSFNGNQTQIRPIY